MLRDFHLRCEIWGYLAIYPLICPNSVNYGAKIGWAEEIRDHKDNLVLKNENEKTVDGKYD